MFEDMEGESSDVTPESADRAIVWAIYARGSAGSITPEEGWAILHERYPGDPRFLLLHAYGELNEVRKITGAKGDGAVLTPSYFLAKVERVLGSGGAALEPQVRDLVTFGGALLAAAKGGDASAAAALRARLGADEEPKRDERDRAGLRLRRFEREVVKELHDRTEGGAPLGVRAAPAAAPRHDWASAVANEDAPRRKYAADARLSLGELVEHPRFGLGVVTSSEPGKAVVLFESGLRKLVAGH